MTLHVSNDPTQDAIGLALKRLDQETFAPFETGITSEDAAQLNLLGVNSNVQYDNFGDLDSLVDTVQGAVFNVGDPERAAAHSEPEFDSARWFMSVVPGSRSQILALKHRWERE